MYELREQGTGRDAERRPALSPPSWLLTAGEPLRFPGEYAASWVFDRLGPSLRELLSSSAGEAIA